MTTMPRPIRRQGWCRQPVSSANWETLYLRKVNALYYEFVENGIAEKLGYQTPADMIERYPQFFWSKVEKHIGQALRYLDMTMEGKQWTATLYSHIFAIEHNRRRTGPQAGAAADHR